MTPEQQKLLEQHTELEVKRIDFDSCNTDSYFDDLPSNPFAKENEAYAQFLKIPKNAKWEKSCIDACSELVTISRTNILDFETICQWLDKHKSKYNLDLFKQSRNTYSFSWQYDHFKEITDYISANLNDFSQAGNELKDALSEQDHINWILKYDVINDKASIDFTAFYKKHNDIYSYESGKYCLKGEPFDQTFNFLYSFHKYHWKLMDKYATNTGMERMDYYELPCEKDEDVFSLRYHLEKRKESEAIGITIPFYLG